MNWHKDAEVRNLDGLGQLASFCKKCGKQLTEGVRLDGHFHKGIVTQQYSGAYLCEPCNIEYV